LEVLGAPLSPAGLPNVGDGVVRARVRDPVNGRVIGSQSRREGALDGEVEGVVLLLRHRTFRRGLPDPVQKFTEPLDGDLRGERWWLLLRFGWC
jgi:hypothetical protein